MHNFKKQMPKAKTETPLMQQYNRIKSNYPEALLLFRVGDFYETFGQDAVTTANVLSIVLTARNNGSSKIELAGFPHHALGNYLPKLVRSGLRVAVCDQLEEPQKGKKIVKRGVLLIDHKPLLLALIVPILVGNFPKHDEGTLLIQFWKSRYF